MLLFSSNNYLFQLTNVCKLVKSLVAPRGCKKDASFPFGPIKFFTHTSIHLDRIGLHTFRFPPEAGGLGGLGGPGGSYSLQILEKKRTEAVTHLVQNAYGPRTFGPPKLVPN